MPEQRTITVYKYDELQDGARENARALIGEQLAEIYNDDLKETFAEVLRESGLPSDKIEWSLGHCQGDGVAFYGDIDLTTWLAVTKKKTRYRRLLLLDTEAAIERNSFGIHYSHYGTMDVSVTAHGDLDNPLVDSLEKELQEFVETVSKKLEHMGYESLEEAYDEENIKALCEANELLFDYKGFIWHEGR